MIRHFQALIFLLTFCFTQGIASASAISDDDAWIRNLEKDSQVNISNPAQRQLLLSARQSFPPVSCVIDICFLLDGASSVPASDFAASKRMAETVFNLLNDRYSVRVCGTQYFKFWTPIAPLAPADSNDFIANLFQSPKRDGESAIRTGLDYAFYQMLPHLGTSGHVVFFGDGKDDGGACDAEPTYETRRSFASIYAVEVGTPSLFTLAQITGDSTRIFTLNDAIALAQRIAVVASNDRPCF